MYYISKLELKNKKYKSFIDYACNRSDAVSIMLRKDHYIEAKKDLQKLCQYLDIELNDFLEKYNTKLYNIIIKSSKKDYWWNLIDRNLLDSAIKTNIILTLQEKEIENLEKETIKRLKDELLVIKHERKWVSTEVIYEKDEPQYEEKFYFNNHFYRINNKVKNYLLAYSNLEMWSNPKFEDLTFYKNGYAWYFQVSHEGYANIEIKNHEEYKFLREIFGQSLDEEKESEYINYERREDLYQDYIKYMK